MHNVTKMLSTFLLCVIFFFTGAVTFAEAAGELDPSFDTGGIIYENDSVFQLKGRESDREG